MVTKYIVTDASKFADEGIYIDNTVYDSIGSAAAYMAGNWMRELSGEENIIIIPQRGAEGVAHTAIDLKTHNVVGELNRDDAWISLPGVDDAWEGCWNIKEVRV